MVFAPTLSERRPFRPGDWRLPPYNGQSKLLRPFLPTSFLPSTDATIAAVASLEGWTFEFAKQQIESIPPSVAFQNGRGPADYIVTVEEHVTGGGNRMFWLQIKRNDRLPIHDWRDLQEIKNMIIGPEYEAVELYPAEERVVDEANQFHLFVMGDPEFRWDFGFSEGSKIYSGGLPGSRQRVFGER